VAAHLKAAGYTDKDITMFAVPEHPKEGVHGLNERRSERSVYVGRDFLNDLVKA
jgi:hypothetical protein